MPNLFRSKNKDSPASSARAATQRIIAAASSRPLSNHSLSSTVAKDSGLPSPPRSPDLAPYSAAGNQYNSDSVGRSGGQYNQYSSGASSQKYQHGKQASNGYDYPDDAVSLSDSTTSSAVHASNLSSGKIRVSSSAGTSIDSVYADDSRNHRKHQNGDKDPDAMDDDGRNGYASSSSNTQQHHPQSSSNNHSEYNQSNQQGRQNPRKDHLATPASVQGSPSPSQASEATRKTSSRYALVDFALIRTLGTGSFGRVHLAKSRHNGRGYAIKVLAKDRVVKLMQVEHTNSEREMLDRVRHPFLVNLWGTFADSKNLYMVMDFIAGGELFSLLRKSQRFPDPVAKFFGAEVALALDYLHSMDIIYRDLKPENILLGADGHIKITDFGFAKYVPDITWTLCGTPDYLAPEIVQSKGYNKSVDWYALGVLIFEMLAGYPPFFTEDSNPMKLYERIMAGKVRYPSYFAPEAKDLLKSLLTADLSKRFGNLAAGSRDIFHHAWFTEVDWERLYRKEIPAPYVPRVNGEHDSSNFDQYPEVDCDDYGQLGPDPHGALFPSF